MWPKYWSFSFSINPSNEYSWLISFRIDWLDLLAVQGTLKILLQHHSSKASIRRSAFFMAQLSHPYMTTGKTLALTIHTSVGKVKGYLLLVGSNILLSIISQQLVAILEFLQEKMSTHPSTPSCMNKLPYPPEMLRGLKQNLVCTRTQRPHREWARPAFECLSVSCGGVGQQWPAVGTGALAAPGLGHVVCGISPLVGGHH